MMNATSTAVASEAPISRNGPPLAELLEPLHQPFAKLRTTLVLTVLAGWGKFMLPLLVPWVGRQIIDSSLSPGEAQALDAQLGRFAAICVAAVIGTGIAAYYRGALAQRMAASVQHMLRRRLFHHLQRLSMAFFQRHQSGSLGARVSSDINQASSLIDKAVVQYALDVPTGLLVLGPMAAMCWQLTLVCVALLAVTALVLRHFTPRIRRQQKQVQEGQSRITGQAAEIFAGISLVKASAGERESVALFLERSEHVRGLQHENAQLHGMFHGITSGWSLLIQATMLLVGAWLVAHSPEVLTKGELVAFLLYVGVINGSLQRLMDSVLVIQEGFAALERIGDILRVLPSPADAPDAATPPIAGSIEFRDVRFAYAGRPALDGLSFTFRRGRTYALVGPSGSGKSTMCQLMLRFYDPDAGAILIDGHDLRHVQQQWYRQHVAVVLQDPVLFSTSIYDNIDFAMESATREQVEAAAKAAQAHDFIVQLPDGYQTRLGERGVALSGGQRQRVAIARALMRDPKLLILDEATAALDTVTERSIQDVIDQLRASRTIVIIAHRLSTIRNVDEILVLERGRLAEHGTYAELVERRGLFARLVAEQESGPDGRRTAADSR